MKKIILLLFSLILFSGFVNAIPNGAYSYWNLSNFNDQWNNYDLTNSGTNSFADYPVFNISGNSAPTISNFDGVSDYASASLGDARFTDNSDDYSVSLWVKFDDVTSTRQVWDSGGSSASERGGGLLVSGGMWGAKARYSGNKVLPSNFGTVNTGRWYHAVYTWDFSSHEIKVYINNSLELTYSTNVAESNSNSSNFKLGVRSSDLAYDLDARMDEVKTYTKVLNTTEISNLFNYGSIDGLTPSVNITYHRVKLTNNWTGNNIQYINVSITNGTHNYSNITLADGTAYFSGLNGNYTYTTGNTTLYFSETGVVQENTTATNILEQSIINISVYKEFEGVIISNYNITLDGKTFTVLGNWSLIYPNANTYTVTSIEDNTGAETYSVVDGSLSVSAIDNKSVNFSVAGHVINIFANSSLDGSVISTFNVSLVGLNFTDVRSNYTTTNKSSFNVNDGSFNITIDAPGYALVSNNIILDVNNSKEVWNYTFILIPTNSVNFTFHDEDLPLDLFTQNVTFELHTSTTANNYSTANGSYWFDNLISDNYEIRYTSDGWDTRSYFFSVTGRSTQNISLYLSNSTETTSYIIRVADLSDTDVPGAIVRLQRQYVEFNGQYVTIEEGRTDTDGETDFFIQESSGISYRFIVLIDDEIVKTTDPQYIINVAGISLKRIAIRIDTGTSIYSSYEDAVGLFTSLTNSSGTWTYQFIDSTNQITGGCLRITRQLFSQVTSTIISNQCFSGTSANLSFNITPHLLNNSLISINGLITYTGGLEVVREKAEVSNVVKGVNADDSDDVLLTAFFFMIVNLAIILIPNILIQIFLSFIGLYFLSWIGFNNLGTLMMVMIMVINLIINWSRKNTKDGEPR